MRHARESGQLRFEVMETEIPALAGMTCYLGADSLLAILALEL